MREKFLQYIHRQKKKLLVVAVVVVLVVAAFVAFLLLNPAYAPDPTVVSFVNDRLAKQHQVEADIQAAYQAGKYTFDQPLVIQDPYHTSPLTALVIFDTPENSQISIHVPGKTPEASVDFTFPGFQKHHELPVYGLYAKTLNHVMLESVDQAGLLTRSTLDLQTKRLPVFIHNFKIDKVDRERYSPGFNFTATGRKLIFDIDGAVRWFSNEMSPDMFTRLKNGRFLFTYKSIDKSNNNIIMEKDLLGKIYSAYAVADTVHHEIYELPNGNLLVASLDPASDTIGDHILEIDPESGHILRNIDLKQILDVNRPHIVGGPSMDWLHLNSIVYDPTDSSIIISSRSQSAVVKLSYPGLQIKWILGPHDNWSPKYQPYLLTPLGDNFEWQWSQHDATLFTAHPAGSDSIDVLLFNNGNFRSFDLASVSPAAARYSNLIHYRINEKAMTVEEVWQYGRERGQSLYSPALGSASLLPNGNVLGCWGHIPANGSLMTKIIEVDPSTNNVVFESTSPGLETYRSLRLGLYAGSGDQNSHLVTSMNNTTGNDLVDRAGMAWHDLQRWLTPQRTALVLDGKRILNATRLWHFQTGLVPQPFDKIKPMFGISNQSSKLDLSWDVSAGVTSYEYCLSTSTPCTSWKDVGNSTSLTLSALKPGTTYYWNVRAVNSIGVSPSNRNPTDWSFTTAKKPAAFTKSSPFAFASSVPTNPTLAWGKSIGATAYWVCFNTTPTCGTWVNTDTATRKKLTGLKPNTTYYWTVKATNGFGTTFANGIWWSFNTSP